MSATVLTITTLSRLLAPAIKDLYSGAKGQVQQALQKLSSAAGIKKLATTLSKIDKVKTIWSPEDEVSLSKFYYPSKLMIDDTPKVVNSERDLPDGNLVIEGIVGQGKSIFMRYLACSLMPSTGVTKIPILLELRNISAKRTLDDSIFNFLKTVGISGGEEVFTHLASSGKLVLLLDGFDEVPDECVTDLIIEIDRLQILHPELRIIISCRPQSNIQNQVGFKILKLVPLTTSDYDPFVKKLISSTPKRIDVVDALNECPSNIQGIISTPLMLTLVIVVYQTEKEIPLSLADFFDKLFGIVFTKHDKLKAGFNRQHYSGLAERRLRELFDAFCFMVVQIGGGRTLKPSEFNKAFDGALKLAKDCHCEVEEFRKDIVKVACLLIEEGLDLTTFLHKSILDYHAAAFVKDLTDARAQTFYLAAAKDYKKWQAALGFLKIIDQARYAKDYYLKMSEGPYSVLHNALYDENDKVFHQYLIKLNPGIEAGFHTKVLVSWGPQRARRNEIDQEIDSAILRTIVHLFSNLEDDKLQALHDKAIGGDKSKVSYEIPFPNIIKIRGIDYFKGPLKAYENTLHATIEEYKAVIAREVTQENIFEDLFGTTKKARRKSGSEQKR
jgi:hypothetical protein